MASSSSRKSSSSASKAPKPTFRRASASGTGAKKASATVKTRAKAKAPAKAAVSDTAPKVKSAGTYAAPTKRASKSAVPKRAAASAVCSKRPIDVKASRAATVTVPAAHPSQRKRVGKLPFRLPLPSRKAPTSAESRIPARNPLAPVLSALGGILGRLPLPHISRGVVAAVAGGLVALAIAVIVAVNSPLFAATDITVNGSEHVSQEVAQKLVKIDPGTTLFNVDSGKVLEGLQANPWVKDVQIERAYPHGLTITPVERAVKAIAYIAADDIAWAIGDDGAWIAPLSLSIAVDANGAEVQPAKDGTLPEGAQQLAGLDAALAIAKRDGALLLTDVPADIEPKAGEPVESKVVNAGLTYAKEFTPEFIAQVKDLSVASVEAISANLTNGVEVSLGEPEDITEKERVVTKLLSQEQGVTYINVREPGAYTFRSAAV